MFSSRLHRCLLALFLFLPSYIINAQDPNPALSNNNQGDRLGQDPAVGGNVQRLNARPAPDLQNMPNKLNVQRKIGELQFKLSTDTRCESDIKAICPESKNNFAVLDCLQNRRKKDQELAQECQHLVWSYKKNLTTDGRFDSAASQVCKDELQKIDECKVEKPGTGFRIACLIEHKKNVTSVGCRQFLTKMGSIVFSDYKLVSTFLDECRDDIDQHGCGRIHTTEDDSPHTQGLTIECLENNVKRVSETCKVQILRIAELQSDDFHLNRPLYYACRDDREKFCKEVHAGDGAVLKCLTKHKFERTMSNECRAKLTGVQKLMDEDVRINRPLFSACKQAIRDNQCFQGKEPPKFHQARQSLIVLCLEGAMADDKMKRRVDGKCRTEIKDTRRAIMEDFKISPDIVLACEASINELCEGGIERGGKTLHCLMQNSRKRQLDEVCQREVEKVIEEVNPGQDVSLDPQLYKACSKMINKCKADKDTASEDMMSCLMDNIESDDMTDACASRVLELQYFISRNFKLDFRLFKACHEDAENHCSADGQWFKADDMKPNLGPMIYACLYKHYKFHAADPNLQLSRSCSFEMRRTLRQRAVAVELNPRIQEPCMQDLALYCDDLEKGDEMECLQKNFEELEPECQTAVGNFTQDEDKDVRMDRALMRACTPMIKSFCKEVLSSPNTKPGDVMECLIKNKNNDGMNENCHAGIEHHQIISLTDYRFTFKFKEACKEDVMKQCKEKSRSKAEVVACLSETIRNDTLRRRDHRVSPQCRKQVTFELLQRSEDVNLDPKLKVSCSIDIQTHCSGVESGKGAILNCLQKIGKNLSPSCQGLVLKRAEVEAVNVKNDYPLFTQCKRMIKTHCSEVKPSDIFGCLKEHKSDGEFDAQCKKALLERMRERAKDIKLNPKLDTACRADVEKYCNLPTNQKGVHFEAFILTCLRKKFTEQKLSESCEVHISDLVKESHIDYKQNPVLAKACQTEIKDHCLGALTSQDLDDHGQVEECLKDLLAQNNMPNKACQAEVIQIIKESKVDVHTDVVLYRACALDIKHVCAGVPRGEGRQMSCLLGALDDSKVKLSPTCEKMMKERRDLWQSAAQVAPAEDMSDLLKQVAISPNRNYFYGIFMTFLGIIFIGGLFCGRVTKRVRAELKNR